MDGFEFNKVAGAVLFALLVMFGTRTVSDIIFAPHAPEKPGFEVAVAAVEGGKPEAKAEKAVPIGELLKAAKAEQGEKIAKKCKACHSFDKGVVKPTGPSLYDVVGRTMAALAGFKYSSALKEKGGEWSYEALDGFLTQPKSYVPGTKMAFAGIKKPEQRADLIAYLRGLSDSPKPLP